MNFVEMNISRVARNSSESEKKKRKQHFIKTQNKYVIAKHIQMQSIANTKLVTFPVKRGRLFAKMK